MRLNCGTLRNEALADTMAFRSKPSLIAGPYSIASCRNHLPIGYQLSSSEYAYFRTDTSPELITLSIAVGIGRGRLAWGDFLGPLTLMQGTGIFRVSQNSHLRYIEV